MMELPTPMSEASRIMKAAPERVFMELSDGWAYVGWVVGASHVRDVDVDWPAPGSRIHHQVGCWPAVISDVTLCLECTANRRLLLQARGWPAGEATVEILLEETAPGQTLVTLREAPTKGPGKALDSPLLRAAIRLRNIESLSRLSDRVENRQVMDPIVRTPAAKTD